MKNTLLFTLLLVSIAANAVSQSVTDREHDGLKGQVQSVRTSISTTIDENGTRTEAPLVLSHVITYDKSGKRTQLATYDRNGILNRRTVFTFDSETKRKNGLIVYDSNNLMVRRVLDIDNKSLNERKRTIEDFNEDGSLYKKTELAFDILGGLTDVAEYKADGTETRKEQAPFNEPSPVVATQKRPPADEDRVVAFTAAGGEYMDPDSHGNWTRGVTSAPTRTHASGKTIKTAEVVYREITYY